MRGKIIGDRDVAFTTETGDEITGKTFYIGFTDHRVNGYVCDKVFVNASKLNGAVIVAGDEVELSYNRFGKVEAIVKVK